MTLHNDPVTAKHAVRVDSEVGRLRKVLVHEPGLEVDRMVPVMMEQLLFDDILFGDDARAEHGRFRRLLQFMGVDVIDSDQLLGETMQNADARAWVLETLMPGLTRPARKLLDSASPDELAAALVHGVRLDPKHSGIEVGDLFELPPIPNWCFQRDPQIVLGGGVIIASMAAEARWRESLLASAVFRFHPAFGSTPILFDALAPDTSRGLHLGPTRPHFEGGDVLVISKDVLAIGYSERTNRTGIRRLVEVLARLEEGPRWLIVVKIPSRRAYMHLDTVLTPIDTDACLVYPPIVEPGGSDQARIFEIDLRSADHAAVSKPDLFAALSARGVDLEPIPCGGDDPVQQQREQWTDGSNAFAVAPGVIVLFDRNVRTAEELAARGFRIVDAEDVLLGRAEVDPDAGERVCILLPSHEVSRARGGPHCLTHPLWRD